VIDVEMNWKNALLRSWIMASIVWVTACVGYVILSCEYTITIEDTTTHVVPMYLVCAPSFFDEVKVRPRLWGLLEYFKLIETALGPPLAPLAIVLIGVCWRWVWRSPRGDGGR
jgi:hypothetical protein